MPDLAAALKEEISRLARKEIRTETEATKKAVAQYRRDIAALKRQVQQQGRKLAFIEAQESRRLAAKPSPEAAGGAGSRPSGSNAIANRLACPLLTTPNLWASPP